VAIIIEKVPGVPAGGSYAVGAWMAEALKESCDVTIVTPDPTLSLRELNDYFGTSLRPEEAGIGYVPMPLVLRLTQKLVLLKKHLLLRRCTRIAKNHDLVIYASGEADFGVRGIQYIHFPMAGRDGAGRGAIAEVYEFLCERVSGYSLEGVLANLTLTNSLWTAEAIRSIYHLEAFVLHPPVPDDYPSVPWESREDGFVCVGRIVPEKRVERIISILKRVRERGWDVHLHLIGKSHDRGYWRSISRLLKSESSWVSAEGALSRRELVDFLVRHKYGMHGMRNEHFGIAVGEMVKAGCVVFVPDAGGQLEIVNDDRLTYSDEAAAVDKICAVLASEKLQSDLRTRLARSSQKFSSAVFAKSVRRIVEDFLVAKSDPPHSQAGVSSAGVRT
jgi:glycosyltransferase involved in cell wall biosynthesis